MIVDITFAFVILFYYIRYVSGFVEKWRVEYHQPLRKNDIQRDQVQIVHSLLTLSIHQKIARPRQRMQLCQSDKAEVTWKRFLWDTVWISQQSCFFTGEGGADDLIETIGFYGGEFIEDWGLDG